MIGRVPPSENARAGNNILLPVLRYGQNGIGHGATSPIIFTMFNTEQHGCKISVTISQIETERWHSVARIAQQSLFARAIQRRDAPNSLVCVAKA